MRKPWLDWVEARGREVLDWFSTLEAIWDLEYIEKENGQMIPSLSSNVFIYDMDRRAGYPVHADWIVSMAASDAFRAQLALYSEGGTLLVSSRTNPVGLYL